MDPELSIEELADPAPLPGEPVVPWVEVDDDAWLTREPLFDLSHPETGTRAMGWAAVTTAAIRLRVVVHDPYHVNLMSGGNTWDGDSIQVGIDARGDSVGALPADTSLANSDDASFCFALTEEGPEAWAHYHGNKQLAGDASQRLEPQIERIARLSTTMYQVDIPWEELASEAGTSSHLGLSVQINDTDAAGRQTRLYWGGGAGGAIRPGLFNRVRIGPLPESVELYSLTGEGEWLWREGEAAQVSVALRLAAPSCIIARASGQVAQVHVPETSSQIRRYRVRYRPAALPTQLETLTVSLIDLSGEAMARPAGFRVMTDRPDQDDADRAFHAAQLVLRTPAAVIGGLRKQAEAVSAPAPDSLMAVHARALLAIVEDQWSRTSANEAEARATLRQIDPVRELLDEPEAQWETIVQRDSAMIRTFRSTADGTLQFYRLWVPTPMDGPAGLIVHLHGRGNADPLAFVLAGEVGDISARVKDPGGPFSFRLIRRMACVIEPWARGNSDYLGPAGHDVLDAVADVQKLFEIDPRRIYLSGHSMGGFGTYALGVAFPEVWAALAIHSGGARTAPLSAASKLRGIPVRLWHGESDALVPLSDMQALRDALAAAGVEHSVEVLAEHGHSLPSQHLAMSFEWLMSKKKR